MEWAIQTSDPDTVNRGEEGEESRAHGGLATRKLVPQKTFKPARRQNKSWDSQVVKFSVHGEEGVRLSDVLEGNWLGFEGRDEMPLSGDDRLQIMIRLHVRLPATSAVHPDN